ncbi:MAG: MauE/DoxX family redox-associated membrane protein [Verrucomicrobiota bacterium JB023]|nr:MauE/DoxX family redox-associated membrane protein [Verrucomicrobiota bacterium JB023]
MSKGSLLLIILRIALGLFFAGVGILKLRDLDGFTEDVANYQLPFLTPPLDAWVAYFVPWLETIAGLLLAIGSKGMRGSLLVVMGSLLVFIAAIASAWVRGLDISCGCFGKSDNPTNYPLHIALNGGLLLLAGFLFWHSLRSRPRHVFGESKLSLP